MFAGPRPVRIALDARPLDVDPDGFARWLVRASFVDAQGRPAELLSGGDVSFFPSRGSAQWQTRLRFSGPAAIVSTDVDGPLSVRVTATVGVHVPPVSIATNTRHWRVERIVARPLGPHAVALGWFPQVTAGSVRIVRNDRRSGSIVIKVGAPCSGYHDETVAPGAAYRYEILAPDRKPAALSVAVPPEPAHGNLEAIAGKSMWLSFSPSKRDADGYDKLDPVQIVAQARAAGLRSILIRTTYGPFDEISPAAKPTIDALIDLAAVGGVRVIAWTVPRSTSFEDVAAEAAAASYVTSSGNGFSALAVDLERGGYFLGDGAAGYLALRGYLRLLRAALGPGYPIIATVEDPVVEHLDRAAYPYDAIAVNAGALQPMVYWRMAPVRITTPTDVASLVRTSYAATLRAAGRSLPVVVGLQSGGYGRRGSPPPDEIGAGLQAARALGAIGVTFFDWNGTEPDTWTAIAATPW